VTTATLRTLAEADLIERTRYDRREGGESVGRRFFDEAMATLHAMERQPNGGSPRVGELCDIPGLRVRRIASFSCGWFYLTGGESIDVVRLLAYAQDLRAILTELDPG